MPVSTPTTAPFTAAALLEATRTVLGRDWMTFPAYHDLSGTIRSHRGHNIALLGAENGRIFAAGILPDGTRREVSTAPAALTPAAYGTALATLITHDLAPAHAVRSGAWRNYRKVRAVAPADAVTTWRHGEAVTRWDLPGHGYVRHTTKMTPPHSDGTPPTSASHVTFLDLTVDRATTLLRAINTDNRDARRHLPVHGALAQHIRAAAPGLRPGDTHNWPRLGGRCTVGLFVDGLVTVELFYCDSYPVNITVHGSMDNQLRAIASL